MSDIFELSSRISLVSWNRTEHWCKRLRELWSYPSIFKWRAYLMVVCNRNAYQDKKKTMSDVEYIYSFFKANKCSGLVSWWTGELHGVAVGELVVGWRVSVEEPPSGVGWGISAVTTVEIKLNTRLKTDYFTTRVFPLRQRPGIYSNGFLWIIGMTRLVIVGVGNSVSCHRRYSFGLKLKRGNFRCGSVVSPTTASAGLNCIRKRSCAY